MGNTHSSAMYDLTEVAEESDELKAATMVTERKKREEEEQARAAAAYIPPGFARTPLTAPKPFDWSKWNGRTVHYRMSHIEYNGDFFVQSLQNGQDLIDFEKKLFYWYNLYSSHDKDAERPLYVQNPLKGGYYAAYDDKFNKWFRCKVFDRVTSYSGEGKELEIYQMECIDYGFHIAVEKTVIYRLRQKYIDALPIQAVPGRLFNAVESPVLINSDLQHLAAMAQEHKWDVYCKVYQVQYEEQPFRHVGIVVLKNQTKDDTGDLEAFDMKSKNMP